MKKPPLKFNFLAALALMGAAVLGFLIISDPGRLYFWPRLAMTTVTQVPKEAEKQGVPQVPSGGAHDIVLVSDFKAIEKAAALKSFDTMVWSQAWMNLLEQECGYALNIDVHRLTPDIISQARAIIITRSCFEGAAINTFQTDIAKAAESGLTIVLEQPSNAWFQLSGVKFSDDYGNTCGGYWQGEALNYCDLPRIINGPGQEMLMILEEMPAFTWIRKLKSQIPDCKGYGHMNDETLYFIRGTGTGRVITLAFDFGAQIQAMQQGLPAGPGFTVRERCGLVPGIPEAQDLVQDVRFLHNDIPYMDIMEDWLFSLISDNSYIASLWRFPYDKDGLMLITHDEEAKGNQAFTRLFKEDKELGINPGVFIVDHNLSKNWPQGTLPACIGIHWDRFWPYSSLATQLEDFRKNGISPRLNRTHFLLWGNDYAAPFRKLAAQNIELDMTYGPNRGKGYLFGTGLPFRALDSNGFELGVRELPFEAQENWAGADITFWEKLLDESKANYHQSLSILLHPHRFAATEKGRLFLKELAGLAKKNNHGLTDPKTYLDFIEARSASRLKTAVQGDMITVEAASQASDLALRLPGNAEDIRVNSEQAVTRPVNLNGRRQTLVKLNAGANTVTFRLSR